MTLTKGDLQAIKEIVQTETRKIVQTEAREIVKSELLPVIKRIDKIDKKVDKFLSKLMLG